MRKYDGWNTIIILWLLLCLAGVAAVSYIVLHFVFKYW